MYRLLFLLVLIGVPAAVAADETPFDPKPNPKQALDLDGYTPVPRVMAQSRTFEGLLAIAKPTIVSNANMIWVKRQLKDRFSFTFATAKWVRFGKGRPVWAVLRHGDGTEIERDRNGNVTAEIAEVALRDLAPEKSHADPGDGDYVRILLRARGCDLYEIGIENMSLGSGHWTEQRRLYLHHGPGDNAWQFVGEGPAETSGHSGSTYSSATTFARARLTGDPKSPVVLEFSSNTCRDVTPADADPACPSLPICREALLDGPLPAKLRWLTDPYVIAGKDADTLDAIIKQYIYWEIDDANEEFGKSKSKEAMAVRNLVEERNPALAQGRITWGEIVYIPSKETVQDRLNNRRN